MPCTLAERSRTIGTRHKECTWFANSRSVLRNCVMRPEPDIRQSVPYMITRHESRYVAHSYFTGGRSDCSSHSPTWGTRLRREGRPNAKPVCGRGLWEVWIPRHWHTICFRNVPRHFRNIRLMTYVYVKSMEIFLKWNLFVCLHIAFKKYWVFPDWFTRKWFYREEKYYCLHEDKEPVISGFRRLANKNSSFSPVGKEIPKCVVIQVGVERPLTSRNRNILRVPSVVGT